jgi:hypothetical protein
LLKIFQVAYDEASFLLIKLLQSFSEISLAPEAQPLDSVPPWKNREKVWFTSHVSMYFKVRSFLVLNANVEPSCFRVVSG